MTSLLAIAINAARDNSYSWLLAASLPAFLYFLTKKRKKSWLQKLIMNWLMKRARRRVKKGKGISDGAVLLLAILAVVGLGALLVWLLGWAWTIIIVLLGLLYLGTKRSESEYQ